MQMEKLRKELLDAMKSLQGKFGKEVSSLKRRMEEIEAKVEENTIRKEVIDFLDDITIGRRKTFRNVAIFPLFTRRERAFDYVTLDEALKNKWIEITETSETGTVPELKVRNKADRHVVIIDGEELIGAKQNRIINITIIVLAGSEITIPVTCTEAGRWSYRTRKFASGVHTYPKLRKAKTEQVLSAMETKGEYFANQSAVWEEIDRKTMKMKAVSPTREMTKIYVQRGKQTKDYEKGLPLIKGASGMVVAMNGKIVCADIFDQPGTARKLWNKLIDGYVMDAIEESRKKVKEVSVKKVKSFLEEAKKGEVKAQKSVGQGMNISAKSEKIVASGLACDNKIVHLSVFAK